MSGKCRTASPLERTARVRPRSFGNRRHGATCSSSRRTSSASSYRCRCSGSADRGSGYTSRSRTAGRRKTTIPRTRARRTPRSARRRLIAFEAPGSDFPLGAVSGTATPREPDAPPLGGQQGGDEESRRRRGRPPQSAAAHQPATRHRSSPSTRNGPRRHASCTLTPSWRPEASRPSRRRRRARASPSPMSGGQRLHEQLERRRGRSG